MKNFSRILIASLLLLTGIFVPIQAKASIKLPALIGNNMVLQQNAEINVWGWADADEKISILASWLTIPALATTTTDGNWKTAIHTPKAGGPYKMIISGRDYSITIENIMIGEVWICSGQSNMEYTLADLSGWRYYLPEVRDEVASGAYSSIRLFTVQKDTSAIPLDNCRGNWLVADTNTVNNFSATAWFYGSYLSEKLGVPIGLISTAWGGTPAEVWTPVASIKAEPELGFYLSHFNGSQWWPGTPGVLYNAMIHPLLNYKIKGAIWYQGESNRSDARLYPLLMNTLITSWREAWQNTDFPFYFVQIAPYNYDEPLTGALLREAQLKCLSVSNTGMAVTMDIAGDINNIHPKNKLDVGKRLALWALSQTYGVSGISFSGPIYSGMKITGRDVTLGFQYADKGLKLANTDKNNFTVAGADHVFYPVSVKIKDSTLLISSPKVKNPLAVRYAFTDTSEATLFNGTGLPASSFRTDDWDIITVNAVLKPLFDPDTKTLSYLLTSKARESDIYYEYNKQPTKNSPRFLNPIPAARQGTLFATVARDGYLSETSQSWKIIANKASGAEITYKSAFSNLYPAGSDLALLDGIVASNKFGDGSWQGFEGDDLDVVIDLREILQVKSISSHFLSDNNSWIFLPKEVSVQVSEDGMTYKNIGETILNPEKEIKDTVIQIVTFPVKSQVRYIKLSAHNLGTCPSWHTGAGMKSWLFVDEIVVE
jgi:sialate O-acetylesterase